MSTPETFEIHIPACTLVGRTFERQGKTLSRTIELLGDVFVEATREPDGSWRYDIGDRGVYYCAGGLATVLGATVDPVDFFEA